MMRGGRSLLVLLVLALALGAYIYFVEAKREPAGTETTEKVFSIDASAIDHLEIHSTKGETTTLDKSSGTWKITAPVAAEADQSAVDAVTNALATMSITRVLDENPASLEPYGLEPAQLEVAFRTSGETTDQRLSIGNKTPTGSDVYARTAAAGRLLLVPSYLQDSLDRGTFELRNRTALAFDRDEVDHVTIDRPGSPSVVLAQEAGAWNLTAPVQAPADDSAVNGILGQVEQARMASIVAEGSEPSAADLRSYGLDRPQVQVTLGAGSTQATLAVGKASPDGSLYARDLSRPMVFTVPAGLLGSLAKDATDLRVKDVFAFKSYTAVGVDVTYGGTTHTFEKKTPEATADNATPTPVWSQTAPEAKDVNQTAMTDLLNTLSSLRADRFVDSAPDAGTDMEVAARFGNAASPAEERVTLRKSGDTVYAIHTGTPGAAVVPTADFDRAVTQLESLTKGQAESQ